MNENLSDPRPARQPSRVTDRTQPFGLIPTASVNLGYAKRGEDIDHARNAPVSGRQERGRGSDVGRAQLMTRPR